MSLGPEMRRMDAAFKQGTVNFDSFAPKVEGDADTRMAALRPELYTLTGLLTPFAVQHLIGLKDTLPPYGLPFGPIHRNTPYDPDRPLVTRQNIKTFADLFKGLMQASILTSKSFPVPEEYKPVVKRLDTLVGIAHELYPKENRYKSTQLFIEGGLNTAIEISVGAHAGIRALAKVERKKTTKQDFIDISGRSSRLATSVAALNLDHINPFRGVIQNLRIPEPSDRLDTLHYFDANLLAFYPDPEAPNAYVDYVKPPEQLIDTSAASRIGDIETRFDTLTCPALPKFGDYEVAIKALWNHITTLSADVKYGK